MFMFKDVYSIVYTDPTHSQTVEVWQGKYIKYSITRYIPPDNCRGRDIDIKSIDPIIHINHCPVKKKSLLWIQQTTKNS